MHVTLIAAGAFLGLLLAEASRELLGIGLGGLFGYLAYRIWSLTSRLETLERRVKSRPVAAPAAPREERPPAPASEPAPAPAVAEAIVPRATRAAEVPTEKKGPFAPQTAAEQRGERSAPPPRDDAVDRLLAAGKVWLTTGNVPVKVGLIILFFGVAFLLKYAVDKQLLKLSIELRLLAVAALGVGLLVLGWRLREKSRVYALNLQGGGIGVLYLTVFAAFRLYSVLPSSVAFALLVVLTVGGGALAVVQNTRWLAILASVGGFLAPVLVSTGQGSHVALFSYYLVINSAILGISWYKAWRSLNLIGFVFTFGVGTWWGFEYYTPELYASTQPFLILNFLFYQLIAILFAFRQPPELRGLVDGTIIFGTPVIAFSLQAQLVADTEYGLAISAAAAALFYASIALWLYRLHAERMRLLMQSHTVLAIGFATLAVPLALDDRWSAITWALEGAGVVWIGVRQSGLLAKLSGSALLFASGYFYMEHGWKADLGLPVLNGNVLGGLIISVSALFTARLLAFDARKIPLQTAVSVALLLWGAGWWLFTGSFEIGDRISEHEIDALVAFFAASFCGLALLARRDRWVAARRVTYGILLALVPLGLLYVWDSDHFLTAWGWIVWPLALAANYVVLWAAEDRARRLLPYLHALSVLAIVAFSSYEALWWVRDAGLNDVWRASAAMLAMIAISALVLALRGRIEWPLGRHEFAYAVTVTAVIGLQLLMLLLTGIEESGDPAPWAYVPVLNPFDLLTLVGLAAGYWCIRAVAASAPPRHTQFWSFAAIGLLGLAFVLTTLSVVRGVHHFSDVAWNGFALRRSVSVQAALSIYWAILGVAGMVIGTRRSHYWIWLVGVGLMGVVVLKLFFVDLGNTGTVARIVSFLGVGLLLLVVGYFAPRPPRPGSLAGDKRAAEA